MKAEETSAPDPLCIIVAGMQHQAYVSDGVFAFSGTALRKVVRQSSLSLPWFGIHMCAVSTFDRYKTLCDVCLASRDSSLDLIMRSNRAELLLYNLVH
jgi:hypothetical protein